MQLCYLLALFRICLQYNMLLLYYVWAKGIIYEFMLRANEGYAHPYNLLSLLF